MDSCYSIQPEDFLYRGDAWLDVGAEDVLIADKVTLLRKSCCLEEWARDFCDPFQEARYLIVSRYLFMMTRDADSISM